MLSPARIIHGILIVALAATGSHAEQQLAEKVAPKAKTQLQEKKLGSIRPVHALGDIYLTGQPSIEDLAILKRAGVKTIITLRTPGEIRWDEAAAVKQHEMTLVQVPFLSPDELTPTVFDDLRKVLNSKKRGPTVLHCGAANRVGAIWYAHRMLDGNLSHEAALKEAKTVGLHTPAYLERAQAYVEEVKQKRIHGKAKNLLKQP
jgi:protein tyrosine phosphatase (PTP) superfamily phosphohydrolase (DUF442 family)